MLRWSFIEFRKVSHRLPNKQELSSHVSYVLGIMHTSTRILFDSRKTFTENTLYYIKDCFDLSEKLISFDQPSIHTLKFAAYCITLYIAT